MATRGRRRGPRAKAFELEPSSDPQDFDAAIDEFRARVPMTRAQWEALTAAAKRRAQFVSHATTADLLNQVWLALDDAVAQGITFDEFKAQVLADLTRQWSGSVATPPARVETIFRTVVQSDYNAGRHALLTEPAVLERRPFWQFRAIEDARTSDHCRPLDGVVRPADDPWWASHTPPLHFNCRSHIVPLTEDDAKDEGIAHEAPDVAAPAGFGAAPEGAAPEWKPNPDDYPEPIAAKVRERLKDAP